MSTGSRLLVLLISEVLSTSSRLNEDGSLPSLFNQVLSSKRPHSCSLVLWQVNLRVRERILALCPDEGTASIIIFFVILSIAPVPAPVSVLTLSLLTLLLSLDVRLSVHMLSSLLKLAVATMLILYEVSVDFVLAIQISDVVTINIIIKDVGSALLVFVDVVVKVILARGNKIVSSHRVWLLLDPLLRM